MTHQNLSLGKCWKLTKFQIQAISGMQQWDREDNFMNEANFVLRYYSMVDGGQRSYAKIVAIDLCLRGQVSSTQSDTASKFRKQS